MKTCEALPESDWQQTEFPWTSSAEGSPAKISALQARAQDLRGNGRAYGENTPELLARFDPASSSWKTSQHCFIEGLATFSGTWPRSGMMRSGIAFQLLPLAPLTRGTGSGLLPTPNARDYRDWSRTGAFLAARLRHSPSISTHYLARGVHWTWIPHLYERAMGFPEMHTALKPLATP